MSYCDTCLHKNVCGLEGVDDKAMTFCADKMGEAEVTETSMHHLICSFCDNDKCVRGTKECEFEKWKEKQESEDIKNA